MNIYQLAEEEFKAHVQAFGLRWFTVQLTEFQLDWLWFIHANSWTLLLAPRGHGKTTALVIYITWIISVDQSIRVLIGMHKEEEADERARAVQQILEDPEFQDAFDIKRGRPWRIGKAFFAGKRHPYMKTVAKQAGMTGWRGDVVWFDDLCTAQNQLTEKMRTKLKNWIWGEVFPALDPGQKQKVIVVGTRKHLEDWYSEIMENSDFQTKIYKIVDEDEEPLWPDRFTPEVIEDLKKRYPPTFFAREFMNHPFAAEGLLFKREWLQFWGGATGVKLPPPERRWYFMGIDPSMGSTTEKAGHAAACIVCVDWTQEDDKIYVVDFWRGKISADDQFEVFKQLYKKWSPEEVIIEDGPANRFFVDEVTEVFPNWVRHNPGTQLTGASTTAKIGRIENIAGRLFRRGFIYLKDPVVYPMTREFIEHEYIQFPEGGMDMLDALNMACAHLRRGVEISHNPMKLWR